MLNGKASIVVLTVGLIKRHSIMSEYFPEPKSSGGRVKIELGLSNYTTKADFKNATGFDKLKNVPTNLSILKSKVDKFDADKPTPVPVDSNN